jgi:sigma-B regulation protein RsbU (phosphoserine phosphatase)
VSGHGIASSLFMSMIHGAIRNQIFHNFDPVIMMRQLNEIVYETHSRDKFVTMIYGVLDATEHRVTFVNAGHPSALRMNPNRKCVDWLGNPRGPALGIMPRWDGEVNVLSLEARESILFYTNGIYEAYNRWGSEFGIEKLEQISLESKDGSLKNWQVNLFTAIQHHIGDMTQDDDLTFLAVRRV